MLRSPLMAAAAAPPVAATAAAAAAAVVTHYTGTGGLLAKITAGLERQGKSPDTAVASDLYAVDQFHIGGASFALRTMAHLAAKERQTLLDVGAGYGGPARTAALEYRCNVVGVDLTPDYVNTGNAMSAWPAVALGDQVELRLGDCTTMVDAGVVAPESMDNGYMIHVG